MIDKEPLMAILVNDNTFQKWKAFYRRVPFTTINKWKSELRKMHKNRTSRTISISDITEELILICNLEDMSFRSRCVEIGNNLNVYFSGLQGMTNATFEHVYLMYQEEIPVATKTDKRSFLNSEVFSDAYRSIDRLSAISLWAKEIIKDIDQSSFTLKRITDIFLSSKHKESFL